MQDNRVVLITDDSEHTLLPFSKLLQKIGYEVLIATDGETCLKYCFERVPHLVILDLMLPKIHGMEVLRQLRSHEKTKDIGVILTTARGLLTDYQTAMENGANYFLIKPLDFHRVILLIKKFFSGKLRPNPFPGVSQFLETPEEEYYLPTTQPAYSYLKLWGTRGSITVSGIEYHRFGGSTSCLELCYENQCIIIDAGTGIRGLGKELLKKNFKQIHLIIGHTHWDHIIGFPFFEPAYKRGYKIDFYGAKGFGKSLRDLFQNMLERDYFPVRLDEMQAKLDFHDLSDEYPLVLGNIKIAMTYAVHPGVTLCFKIQTPQMTIGYVTDNEFLIGYHGHPNHIQENDSRLYAYKQMIQFFKDCDLLIHEAQYTPEQYRTKVGWGHSSISNVVVLIKLCNIKQWWITHHDPEDTDEGLHQKVQLIREILKECHIQCEVRLAYDGILMQL